MYHHQQQQLSMEVSDYFPKDHFIVEDLFNFSTDDANDLSAADGGSSFDAAATNFTDSSSSGVNAGENYCNSFTAYDFSEPTEEVAELEWLSNFVEDCFSNNSEHQFSASGSSSPAATATTPSQFTGMPQAAIPAKARSKRSRANPSSWAARVPVLSGVPAPEPAMSAGDVTAGRRCLHCGSEKTPQWRMGPMGPKTLCNACGVRYKSGRLVPEYRPAASPTFMMSEHSNSHRKVVELRRQKEEQQERRQQQQQQHHQQMMYWS